MEQKQDLNPIIINQKTVEVGRGKSIQSNSDFSYSSDSDSGKNKIQKENGQDTNPPWDEIIPRILKVYITPIVFQFGYFSLALLFVKFFNIKNYFDFKWNQYEFFPRLV